MLRRVIVDDGHAGIRGLVTYLTSYLLRREAFPLSMHVDQLSVNLIAFLRLPLPAHASYLHPCRQRRRGLLLHRA